MILRKYQVRYWDGLDWCWVTEFMLAQTEQQIRDWVDKQCKPEYRKRRNDRNEMYETLEIFDDGEATLPYVL